MAQVGQAGGGVHVHMAAHGQGAEEAAWRISASARSTIGGALASSRFSTARRSRRLATGWWAPAVADEAFVQVDVAVDEAGQHQQAFEVDGLAGGCAGALRADVADAAVAYGDEGQAIGVDGIDELTVVHERAFYRGLGDVPR
jgi:hypothetical protein